MIKSLVKDNSSIYQRYMVFQSQRLPWAGHGQYRDRDGQD